MTDEVKSTMDEFMSIYRDNIHRDGSEALLEWLKKTDFFTAPASTRFHSSYEGGLCRHSINVYNNLLTLTQSYGFDSESYPDPNESIAIVSLLHDLCKANFYKVSTRNAKNETTGRWEKVPFYQIEDRFPYGHGEKSVILIQSFIKLSRFEAVAVRWHMGAYNDRDQLSTMGQAFDQYPLALLLHTADLFATHFDECCDKA